MDPAPGTLLSFGHGYSARALARLLPGWRVIGTTRTPGKVDALEAEGVEPRLFPGDDLSAEIAEATHLLTSIAPDADGDPVLRAHGDAVAEAAPRLAWAGYLSTTGVYGDHGGGWVDEDTPPAPSTARGEARVHAEEAWRAVPGLPLHVFRLAGIYGPGRGPFAKIRAGTARRIVKPGQVFSRIHVDDIAATLRASIERPAPGTTYNVCDDAPAPPQDVLADAAAMLDLPPPPEIAFEEAELSPMARSFYAESKRVRNDRIKALGVRLRHPDHLSGLRAILDAEGPAAP
jgi:nucleoside-diphosphate-sugar epimerase